MTQFESVTGQSGSATVEVGTVIHEGQRIEALGAIIDTERGLIVGYPHHGNGNGFTNQLRTWDGKAIAALEITGTARGFNGVKLTCYAMTYEGRRYHGRGLGDGMSVRMHGGKVVKP
jgi:hypothetical protein